MVSYDNVFHGVKDIKYLLKTEYSSLDLLIIFSTYCNDENVENTFTDIDKYEKIRCNKLFIVDDYGYKNKGCWFLGENGRLSVEKSVINLISGVIKTINVKRENIILTGYGNGGFASIYYGLKYKFKNVIAVQPQIMLGEYLKSKEEVLEKILGEKNKNRMDVLDNLILNIEPEINTKIWLYVANDIKYINSNITPFFKKYPYKNNIILDILVANEKNVKFQFDRISVDLVESIFNNSYIPDLIDTEHMLMDEMIIKDIDKNMIKDRIKVEIVNSILVTYIKPINKNHDYACYLSFNNEIIDKQFYKRYPEFRFDIKEVGKYRLLWRVKDEKKNEVLIDVPLKLEVNKTE